MQQETPEAFPRIARPREVRELTGLSKTGLERLIREGKFPKPLKISTRAAGWPLHEVRAWIAQRISERDGGSA
jgi:prophage regulatory protein